MIRRLVARGDLHAVHRGVYVVGRPELDPYGRAWAAFLATRGTGRVAHRRALARWSAAAALGVADHPQIPEIVTVGAVLAPSGVTVRRARNLPPEDTRHDELGLVWTALPRTLVDLASVATQRRLEDVLDRADRARILDVDAIIARADAARGTRGLPKLRRALGLYEETPAAVYRSRLERFAARVLVPSGIPMPEINGPVVVGHGVTIHVDLLFRERRLAVELDGRDHGRGQQFQSDRWRDRELQKLGYRVLRFTWYDVRYRGDRVLTDIRRFLAAPAPAGV